jgi:hypothetical protein
MGATSLLKVTGCADADAVHAPRMTIATAARLIGVLQFFRGSWFSILGSWFVVLGSLFQLLVLSSKF